MPWVPELIGSKSADVSVPLDRRDGMSVEVDGDESVPERLDVVVIRGDAAYEVCDHGSPIGIVEPAAVLDQSGIALVNDANRLDARLANGEHQGVTCDF